MTDNNLLSTIFQNKYNTPEFEELLHDKSIKGKFKYIMNYSPSSISVGNANILVHYLIRNSCHNNTLFSFNGGQEGLLQRLKRRSKRKSRVDNNLSLRLPTLQFKNFKCNFEDVNVYISNIFISEFYHAEIPYMPPMILILSIDSNLETHEEFWATGIITRMMYESKKWHMTNVIGEEYSEDKFCEVYTYNDGYWDLKRGNRVRNKDTLFIEEEKYDKLITKVKQFNDEKTRSIYERLNIPYKLNILLHGPPGCGKTSFIEIIAAELKRDIRFMQITPKITDEQFSSAISGLGDMDILVCEDIDCLFVERKNSDTQKNAMTFSGLLNCFDGINGGKNGLIVFMTTNYKCRLDKALTRPGRVDLMSEFTYMSKDTVKRMVKFYMEDKYSESEWEKLYEKISEYKLTGAIVSQFLLSMVLEEKTDISKHYKLIKTILEENNYEESSAIQKHLYT
tara:strand:+ start:1072 stop:2427 length:1356 start_codon:yes stop_codon:yes gene_type:complete